MPKRSRNEDESTDSDGRTTTNDSDRKRRVVSPTNSSCSSSENNEWVDDNETPAKQTQAIAPLFLVTVRDGIHEIQFDMSTLMTSSGHKSVRPLFHGICEKIVKTFLLEGNIRVPVCLSSTSSQLEVEPLPLTTPIVYIRYKDTNFSEIEKIGMGMAMKTRYPQEVLERCHVLCNTTWAYHQDGDVRKLLEEFLVAIDNSSQVPDALKDIFKLYKRGGDKLGMEHNLYMQMLEISCQLYFGQRVSAEAFTCDEKKLLKRRQKVAAVVNYLLPKLFDLLKVNGEMVFRATNENIHCTTSWATGADKDRLSSEIVVTNYISNDAPWEDTLPIPVHPNGKTRKKIFEDNFSEKAKKTGRQIFRKNVERCMKEQRLELLDTNNIIVPRGQAEDLLIELRFVCFATVKDPSNDNHGEKDDSPFLFNIFIYPPTKSVLFLHSPLSIGLDSRECIPLRKSLARLEGAEMIKLLFRGLQTGNEYCSGAEILQSQNQNDAIFAGFALESITKCFHQNKRIACAAGRDVLTGNSINVLAQNAMFKRLDHISGISRKGRMAHHRVNPEEGRAVDQLVLVRSVNILSNHGLPKDFGRYPLTRKEMDR